MEWSAQKLLAVIPTTLASVTFGKILLRPKLSLSLSPRNQKPVHVYDDGHPKRRGTRVRVHVINRGWATAKNCSVFVRRVLLNGRIVENQKSQLEWTGDIDKDFEPKQLKRHEENGRDVDVCGADDILKYLHATSRLEVKGGHRYPQSGTYTFELSAEADWPAQNTSMRIDVEYSGDWKTLKVNAHKENREPWYKVW